jgi:hypothetical protein
MGASQAGWWARLAGLEAAVTARLEQMAADRIVERIWSGEPAVWGGSADTPELTDRLGWLRLPESIEPVALEIRDFAVNVRRQTAHVVLCGMGGSSLAPEVFWRTFGPQAGFPSFTMLDSTAPAAVRAAAPNPSDTLFLPGDAELLPLLLGVERPQRAPLCGHHRPPERVGAACGRSGLSEGVLRHA